MKENKQTNDEMINNKTEKNAKGGGRIESIEENELSERESDM